MSAADGPGTLADSPPDADSEVDTPGANTGRALVIASLFGLQGGGAVATGLFSQVSVPGVVTLRLALAAVIMLAACRPRLGLLRQSWRVVGPAGVVLYLHHLCFYQAIDRIPLGTATTIEFLGPFLLGVWLSPTLRHRLLACLALPAWRW